MNRVALLGELELGMPTVPLAPVADLQYSLRPTTNLCTRSV